MYVNPFNAALHTSLPVLSFVIKLNNLGNSANITTKQASVVNKVVTSLITRLLTISSLLI